MSQNTDLSAHSQDICARYLDGQPYDRLRLVNETRFCLAQSAESMLEAGKRLITIKESEPHGDFIRILEHELGLNRQVAFKMMKAAIRFLSPRLQKKSSQFALLGKSKLYELMLEDDDDLEALADGGTVAGLELDEIERMSCRELKKALRASREDSEAKDQVLADKASRIAELETEKAAKKKKIATTPPDEEGAAIRAEADGLCFEVEVMIRGQFVDALTTAQRHADTNDLNIDGWLEEQLNLIDQALLEARGVLSLPREVRHDTNAN